MKRVGTCWSTTAALLALAATLGCEGLRVDRTTAQSPGTLMSAPRSVRFGNLHVGTTQTQSSTITNSGGSSLTITHASVKGTGFSSSALRFPLTLKPGQSTSFNVTFAPQFAGNYTGSVTIDSNASDPTLTTLLTGSATGQRGLLSVSPTTINVGNVVVGTSRSQSGTLTAIGASVTVSSVNLGSSEFSIGGLYLPLTIAAGHSMNFTLRFTPQTSGVASVTGSFTSNAFNSPMTTTLTGTGTPAPIHTVSLSWTASTSSNIAGYNIYRAVYTSTCGSYSRINSGLNAITTYADTSVVDGQTYCYVTTAVDSSAVESGYSNTAQAAIPPP